MIKKITEILNLLVSIVKARWIFLLGFSAIFSLISWLRWKLLSPVEIRLPLFVIILVLIFVAYPILKFFEWVVLKSPKEPVLLHGLLWQPSRFRFRYPEPLCPQCKSTILFQVEIKQIHVVQSLQDFNSVNEDMRAYIYECPNHGNIQVPNRHISNLQKLAKAKIDSQNKHHETTKA
jgi:hypothetical protein